MKRKIFLTIAFLISLAPMFASQYGGVRGIREISGFANLMNPLGIISFLLVLAGLWIPFKNHFINKLLSIIGLIGILAAEILTFLLWPTWSTHPYRESIDLEYSFANAFPEFYLGLATSALMLITYVCTMSLPEDEAHSATTKPRKATKATPRATTTRRSSTRRK